MKLAPLTLSLSPRGEGTPSPRQRPDSLSQPHPLADADTKSGKLAKASLRGEGWGEGVLTSGVYSPGSGLQSSRSTT